MRQIGILYNIEKPELQSFLDYLRLNKIHSSLIYGPNDPTEYNLAHTDGRMFSSIKECKNSKRYEIVVSENTSLDKLIRQYIKKGK